MTALMPPSMQPRTSLLLQSKILHSKRILVCVSSSIAIYKALELISLLKKMQAEVRVVMSEEAKKFITPLCFEALTHTKVLHTQSESWAQEGTTLCNHISYAKWADIALIAPASANTIAKLAAGISDNLLLSTLLACSAPKFLAPAMNTQMLLAPQTQNNLLHLQTLGYGIIPPRESLLACATFGDGALAEVEEILFHLTRALLTTPAWQGKRVIITGGGSKESIDSVRCISNHSSGLQASALAVALYSLGAEVILISSIFPTPLPKAIRAIEVSDTQSYLEAIHATLEENPNDKTYLFMAAAIADFIPQDPQKGKIKKQANATLELKLAKNTDILASLDHKNLIKIGFKAESDAENAKAYAAKMLEEKNCACVCLNILTEHNTFGSTQNAMHLITKTTQTTLPLDSKLEIAFGIASFISTQRI